MSECVNDAANLAGLWLILFCAVVFFYQVFVLRWPWIDVWRFLIRYRDRDIKEPHATALVIIFVAGFFLAVAYALAQCGAGGLISDGS